MSLLSLLWFIALVGISPCGYRCATTKYRLKASDNQEKCYTRKCSACKYSIYKM